MKIGCYFCPNFLTWEELIEENLMTSVIQEIEFKHKGWSLPTLALKIGCFMKN